MTALDELTKLLPPPERRPAPDYDWPAIEAETGTALPHDYKCLVETYGPVRFSANLRLCTPHGGLDLACWTALTRELLGDPDFPPESEHVPAGFALDPSALQPWGSITGNEYCLWYTAGPDPDTWPVIVGGPAVWGFYRGTVTEFVLALLTRTLPHSEYFDDISEFVEDHGAYCVIDRDGAQSTIHAA
ncbi:hypothetical protein [Nocardia aurantia]|uniref:Knr4/Smi1-like domain-containing protein n=1 Tax=Nocardia aurantia TaxID=2585199 RepID=A0A7K0DSR0_9NOCA|nr:hypothetical protein [Nocardia aurantia]MQY28402.1 hypothetical protein [Nocardia aurantia]